MIFNISQNYDKWLIILGEVTKNNKTTTVCYVGATNEITNPLYTHRKMKITL